MKILLFLFLPLFLFAQSFMLSNIPRPKTYIQDLDPYECNEKCMKNYIDQGMFLSFLSRATTKLKDRELNEMRVLAISILNLASFYEGEKFRIALLLPYKKIGKYASSTSNATFAYLMTKSHPFMLKSYKVETEELDEVVISVFKKAEKADALLAPYAYDYGMLLIEERGDIEGGNFYLDKAAQNGYPPEPG